MTAHRNPHRALLIIPKIVRDLKHKIKIQSSRTVRANVQLIIIEESEWYSIIKKE